MDTTKIARKINDPVVDLIILKHRNCVVLRPWELDRLIQHASALQNELHVALNRIDRQSAILDRATKVLF